MASPFLLDRAGLVKRLKGCYHGEPNQGPIVGGRTEALRRLHAYNPASYGRWRNFLDAPVSRLSPYLRHGMISTVEVRDFLKANPGNDPAQVEEFLKQLAWRDFFEKVLAWFGRDLENDLEEPKHPVTRSHRIPLDVLQGETGLPCMDGMLQELYNTGYLHNHARLWFAAYLCHFRGIAWQEGARLFRQYLLDGDWASNSCSWQWVEGTFAAKPYFANRENIARFSKDRWCRTCKIQCPFDVDYPTLHQRLFGKTRAPLAREDSEPLPFQQEELTTLDTSEVVNVPASSNLVWVHDSALSWNDPALATNPEALIVFVFNEPVLRAEPWAYHRLAFVMDGLEDLFHHLPNPNKMILVGNPTEQLAALASTSGATSIHLSEHPNPEVVETAHQLQDQYPVVVHPRPVFAEYAQEPRRFSRYWERVAFEVLGHRPKFGKRTHS